MSDFWAYVLHIRKKKANIEEEGNEKLELDSCCKTQKLEPVLWDPTSKAKAKVDYSNEESKSYYSKNWFT